MIELLIIEESDRVRFVTRVEEFCTNIGRERIVECKFQRNLYYSLSGSTVAAQDKIAMPREQCSEPTESFVAFILYETVEP